MKPNPSDELTVELFERCSPVVEFDAPQLEGFVSGLLSVWDGDAGDDEALAFVEHCRRHPGPRSALVCSALAVLDDGPVGVQARSAADSMASMAGPVAGKLGRSMPAQAWQVDAPFGRSIVVGFASGRDGIDHAVLAEIDGDKLVDLQLSGAPEELLDTGGTRDGVVTVVDLEVGAAIDTIVRAWTAAHGRVDPTPAMFANQRLVAARLTGVGRGAPALFRPDPADTDLSRGMSEAEIAEADRAALSTLRAAVGDAADQPVHGAWTEVLRASVPGLSPRERSALLWLEWADWLGVGIGVVRGLDRVPLSGEVLVDLVNRCPEVSSTIHADDRDYAVWAFEVALDHLRDVGLVVGDELTGLGRDSLHPSLVATWSDAAGEDQ